MKRKAAGKPDPKSGVPRAKAKRVRHPRLKLGGFKQIRPPRVIPILIQTGSVYPSDTVKVRESNSGGPDRVLWVNLDEREYTITFDDPPGSPFGPGLGTITLPAFDKQHYGTAGPFSVVPGGKGTHTYTLTAVNWSGGPGGPDITVE